MKKHLPEYITLSAILLLAAFFRFDGLNEMAFSYDELSAIFRARAAHWQDHLIFGVYPDGHPQGVQTFLWLWLKYMGENPFVLKSITAVLGLASIFFVFKSGETLFDKGSGIMASAFMAFGSLPLFWSLQIRPYAFGIPICTALLWIWSVIISRNKTSNYLLVVFAILAALSAYIHYFNGLFAFLLFLSLFNFKSIQFKKLLLTGLLVILLSIPIIPILLHQIQNQGLDWLGKPQASFLTDHIFELINKSKWIIGIFIILTIRIIVRKVNGQFKLHRTNTLYISILALLFILPFAIGFVWSWLNKPVLQHTVLLFSAPCLFLIMGYFLYREFVVVRRSDFWNCTMPVSIISLFLITPLVTTPQYTLMKKEGYSAALNKLHSYGCQVGMYPQLYAEGPKDVIDYHWKNLTLGGKECESLSYIDQKNGVSLNSRLKQITKNPTIGLVLNSGSSPFIIPILESIYGLPTQRVSFVGTEFLTFSTHSKILADAAAPWKFQLTKSPVNISFKILNPSQNDVVVCRFTPSSDEDLISVANCEIQSWMLNDSEQIDWRSSKFSDWVNEDFKAFHCIKLADIPKTNKNTELFFSTQFGGKYVKGLFEIYLSKGNPYLYGVN